MLALTLSGIAGVAGLGTEAANWYSTKRTMQGAADSAAIAAAAALAAGEANSTFATQGKSVAASYHFVDGSGGTKVTVNYPPKSGSHQSSPAVEVIISQTQALFLSSLFMATLPTISARAVGLASTGKTGQACVVALDPNNETSFTTTGTAALAFNGCSLYVDSPSTIALNMAAGSTISASIAYVVGGIGGTGLTTANGTYTGVNPLIDPYINAAVPTFSGCDSTKYHLSAKSTTINVGTSGVYVFCNGVTLDGGATLTLGPGTFIVDQGTLRVTGGSTLSATSGTTVILTSSAAGNACASPQFDGGSTESITAPVLGPLAGLALYLDRACTDTTVTNSVGGGANQNITGAIYFPGEPINFGGGTTTGGAVCTQLIAWSLNFIGNSNFNSACTGTGTKGVSLTGGRLVE